MARSLSEESLAEIVMGENVCCALDDLVPGECESGIYGERVCVENRMTPHEMERLAQRALLGMPRVQFSSLQVHRLEDGICLTGVVKVSDSTDRPNFERVAGTAAGVTQVLNRLVVQREISKK